MRLLHSSRTILAINGIVLIFMGLSFFFFAEHITIKMFPNIQSNPAALEIAVILRYLMGAGSLATGIILYLARISVRSGAQRVLMGSGIGFIIIFLTSLYIFIKFKADIPYFGLILYPALGLVSLYVSSRKFQE